MPGTMSTDEITLAIDSMPVADIAQIAARALGTSEKASGLKWKATKFGADSIGDGTLGLWRMEDLPTGMKAVPVY